MARENDDKSLKRPLCKLEVAGAIPPNPLVLTSDVIKHT